MRSVGKLFKKKRLEQVDTKTAESWHYVPGRSGGRRGSGGKSCRLAVGGSPVRSHPGCVEVSLSKTPNPQLLLMSWLVPCMAANRRWCVCVCVCVNG